MISDTTALAVFVSPTDRSSLDLLCQQEIARRTLSDLSDLDVPEIHVFTDEHSRSWIENLLSDHSNITLRTDGPDGPTNLSRKVQYAFDSLFEHGHQRVIALAADTPNFSRSHVKKTIRRLKSDDRKAVIGPSKDGGFYLLGLNQKVENLFNQVPFFTTDTGDLLAAQLAEHVESIHFLEALHDIDRMADWFNLSPIEIVKELQWIYCLIHEYLPLDWLEQGRVPLPNFISLSFGRKRRAPPSSLS